jgi:hypothetical protein
VHTYDLNNQEADKFEAGLKDISRPDWATK